MLVSQNSARFSCFKTWFIRGSSIVPVLSHHTMLLLSLLSLVSRKIKRPLLAGYKVINNNNFKDTSFWILWPILSELHLLKKVTFWGKIHCRFCCLHTTLWRLICPFPKKLASHNSMQNKDDKVGNKTANKQGRQRERRQQERKIEIDSQKKPKFWLLRMREKQKSCSVTSD